MKIFLKGKVKNKFILGIIIVILLIVGIQSYISFSLMGVDRNSYVVLVEGEAELNGGNLQTDVKEKLSVGDMVETVGEWSIAVVEWGDGSLTRLGGDSRVIIKELGINKDLSKINVSFSLEDGKTWSNVISFLGEESYFKQSFEDVEASVRGTVFDVDLNKDYVYVQDHEVILKREERELIVKENSALSISSFSFIELKKFLNEMRDKAWEKINMELDEEYFSKLKADFSQTFSKERVNALLIESLGNKVKDVENFEESIKTLSEGQKKEIYDSLLEQYQKLNFVSAGDGELFESKNQIKKLLIQSADEEDQKILVKYSLYDLKDAIDLKDLDAVKDSLSIIGDHSDILKKMDISIFDELEILPGPIKDLFQGQGDLVKDIFGENLSKFNLDNLNGLTEKAKSLLDSSTKGAIDSLDNVKGQLEGLLDNIK